MTVSSGKERSAAAGSGGHRSGGWVDPQALMMIQNLEMRARVVVQGFWNGLHRSPYHGFSVEFSEYRQYTPGDDIRYLDWRLYARSDRYYIKKFEDETNLRCHLLVDNSRSMGFGSLPYTKAEYANTLAATLAYFLYLQGDAVGLMTFDEQFRDYLPARHRTGHLRHLMLALEKPAGGSATSLESPLKRIVEIVGKRGLMVLISDLLAPIDALEKHLVSMAACGHEVQLFQVLDPAEVYFRFDQAVLFEDSESGRDLYIDPAMARKEYLERMEAHNGSVRRICEKLGLGYTRLTSDQPLEVALFDFLRDRMQRGKKLRGSRDTFRSGRS
ncbi:MAG TPA: DUF58 domain-containing protein [Methylomirabilota bacterium]|nr:DUF58 domain-containing protein [Methylomirabilota bacterium]